jgi:hypothetical protein
VSASTKTVRVFELIAYLASSARGLLEEPREYGSLRCLDAMRRLIDLALKINLVKDSAIASYLLELKGKLSKGILLLLYNPEEFKKFIVDVNIELARKAVEVLEKQSAR